MAGKRIILFLFCFFLFISLPVLAQEMAVPIKSQVPIFLKALTYDRNLKAKAGPIVKFAVVCFNDSPSSRSAYDEFTRVLKDFSEKATIRGKRFSCTGIKFTTGPELGSFIISEKINVLYITPDAGEKIKEICSACRSAKVLTLTGVEEYMNQGVSLGIGLEGEKPKIIINLFAVRAEGHNFDSNFLRICRVIVR